MPDSFKLPALRGLGDLADHEPVLGSLAAWECRFDVPIVYAATPAQAALEVERWCWYFAREMVEAVNDLRRSVDAKESR